MARGPLSSLRRWLCGVCDSPGTYQMAVTVTLAFCCCCLLSVSVRPACLSVVLIRNVHCKVWSAVWWPYLVLNLCLSDLVNQHPFPSFKKLLPHSNSRFFKAQSQSWVGSSGYWNGQGRWPARPWHPAVHMRSLAWKKKKKSSSIYWSLWALPAQKAH